jgi:hypothetical protein
MCAWRWAASYIASKQEDKGIAVLKEVVGKSPEKKAEAGLIIADRLQGGQKDDALARSSLRCSPTASAARNPSRRR